MKFIKDMKDVERKLLNSWNKINFWVFKPFVVHKLISRIAWSSIRLWNFSRLMLLITDVGTFTCERVSITSSRTAKTKLGQNVAQQIGNNSSMEMYYNAQKNLTTLLRVKICLKTFLLLEIPVNAIKKTQLRM